MRTYIIIGFAVAVVLILVFRKKIPFVKRMAESGNPKGDAFAPTVFLEGHYRGNTPKGARVYSYMADVSAATREQIDAGMQRTFDIAREHYFYTGEGLTHGEYMVSVWPRSNKCEQAGFITGATKPVVVGAEEKPGYDQGPFDKDPRPGFIQLCVAGEFRLFNNKLAISVVDDPNMTFNAARYETEHAVLFKNDIGLYEQTRDHSQGGGHPILTDNAEPAHFARVQYKCGGGHSE